jgi:cholesterol oxidase
LHLPQLLETLGIRSLTAEAREDERWYEKLYDRALQVSGGHEPCHSAVCRRISFMYGPLYRHEMLNEATHEALPEMFGVASVRAVDHLALMTRTGHVVDSKGNETYMPGLQLLSLPLCFIAGERDECLLAESTQRTYESLCKSNGKDWYTLHVIPGYGHSDCIFGKDAVRDVYPRIVAHLERTSISG